ncbi:MAG: PQQ-binding-like beta-propeller repeat protein [Planctomycetaceae bacterium]
MRCLTFLALAGLTWTAASVTAEDWPGWRGPENNGISLETGLVDTWNFETGENVLWTKPIGGRAAPIVMNGRVYLDCRTNDDVTSPTEKVHAREQVICRDAATGETIWQDVFNVAQTDIPAPRVGWASMVGDPETGNVYLHSVSSIFRCYDRDGNVLWNKFLFEEYGKISGYGGRTQTPIIDEDRIIVGFFGLNWGRFAAPPPKMSYYAFDKRTGDLLWVAPVGKPPLDTNYSNPVIAVVDGQRLLIGGGADGGIHAINARTGAPVWSFEMSKRGLNATPAVDGHLVYIAHGEDNIDSLAFGRIECIDARGTGDITKSNSVWRVDDIKAGYTGLVVKDGILYVVADTGKLHAFDSQTGTELWNYSLGTVGKGSPTWADGKLYVMEVNGNIHILKPSRSGVESLSRVTLKAGDGNGLDEIYGTPAISDGRVFFVTRDRTIAVGNENAGKRTEFEHPNLKAEEADGGSELAMIQVRPFETRTVEGGTTTFSVHGFNRLGQPVDAAGAELSLPEGLKGVTLEGDTVTVAADAPAQGFEITAKSGDLTAFARMRTFPPLPWSWDFEGLTGKQVPPTWVNAFIKLVPEVIDGNTVMKKAAGKGTPSVDFWIGYTEMDEYTVQADVMMKEDKRKLPSIGLTAQRYNLILKGNTSKLGVQSWAPHMRIGKEVRFVSKPDVWYTMKLTVQVRDDGAHVLGKVWERDKAEPEEWTTEVVDPHPNPKGSPGLYVYSLADAYFDNVKVSK